MRIFSFLIGIVLFTFLFLTVGAILLEQFPQLQPLWGEFKDQMTNLYNYSMIKYGALPTLLIIAGLFVFLGGSKGMK